MQRRDNLDNLDIHEASRLICQISHPRQRQVQHYRSRWHAAEMLIQERSRCLQQI